MGGYRWGRASIGGGEIPHAVLSCHHWIMIFFHHVAPLYKLLNEKSDTSRFNYRACSFTPWFNF